MVKLLDMKNYSMIKLVAVALLGFAFTLPATAAPMTELTKKCKPLIDKNQKLERPPLRGMPEKIHKRVTRALELVANDQYAEGIEGLKSVLESSSDDYIKSVVSMNVASAYAQQNNYKASLPYFEDALKYGEGNLDHDRLQALRQNVASLFYSIGKKQEALEVIQTWIKKSIKDDPKSYVLLAVIYAEMGKYRDAVCPAYYAVETQSTPNKQYYSLLLVSHYELKDIVGSAVILKEMVTTFPEEKSYWRQLASLYLSLDNVKEALALMEMLYLKGGFDSESDYKTLSSLFAYEEIPYRSAQILEEGVNKGIVKTEEKNWRQIASSYRVSKEIDKAIDAYGKTADLAKDGEEYLTQAELFFEKEQWRDSIKALEKALDKGVDDKGRAYFTKGSALASLGQCKNAVATLEDATKYSKWRTRANAWIDYINERLKTDRC
jgi:tetratricopeptide (TPR) repeat protein